MRHTFQINGIWVNPKLRAGFDTTPHAKRSQKELDMWWEKPYILIHTYRAESYIEHSTRLQEDYARGMEKMTELEFNEWNRDKRETWYAHYPNGFQYEVRMLYEGSWDRSTSKGYFGTFEEALSVATALLGEE